MNEPENTSDAMMLTGAGRYEEQSEEILITDGGTLSTLTDDMIFKEIVPAMEACGNPFREDVEEAVLETRRMLQESWKRIIDHDELSDVISHSDAGNGRRLRFGRSDLSRFCEKESPA